MTDQSISRYENFFCIANKRLSGFPIAISIIDL